MTTNERIDKLATAMVEFERITRQGFATLTELHADTQRDLQKLAASHAETQREMGEMQQAMKKLANSMSALADHVADHDTRLDKLEGK
jgi:predicted  nucleic acid-binding Zn-ribbon protein